MTTAYFSKIEEKILSNLANAKHNLQIAVAWFTNHKLAASVEQLYKYKTTELSDQDSHELKEIRHCLRLIEKRI